MKLHNIPALCQAEHPGMGAPGPILTLGGLFPPCHSVCVCGSLEPQGHGQELGEIESS